MQSRGEKSGLSPRDKGLISIVAFVIVVLLMLAAITFMFRIENIVVKGSSSYSSDDIVAAADIEPGKNLLTVDTGAVAKRVQDRLFNVESVKVSRSLLHSIVVDVEPAEPVANFITPKAVYIISAGGKVMLITDKARAGLYNVVGAEPSPMLLTGDRFTSNDSRKDKVIFELIDGIRSSDTLVAKNVTLIDVQSFSNLKITYDNRIDIVLGSVSELDYKLNSASDRMPRYDGMEGMLKFQTDPSKSSFIDRAGLDYNEQVYQSNIESYRAETSLTVEGEEGAGEGEEEEPEEETAVRME
ncbi:MAG: FtsQ-type POTRA domain-containing protein [Oscillospiraceae bacterium]|nr:FtsQ-type POTRA domain-containing protein [Oscillospiraceae bacterium]